MKSNENNKYRYERKYIIPQIYINQVLFLIETDPDNFQNIYSDRRVNNIYFDTLDFTFYHSNLNGLSSRDKLRMRWYGELYGDINPSLELKSKKGSVGKKDTCKLNKINFIKTTKGKEIIKRIIQDNRRNMIIERLKYCQTTLLNSYKRKYYESFDTDTRITIDYELENYSMKMNIPRPCNKIEKNGLIILELKYSSKNNFQANKLFNSLNFRINKFSKYVEGINHIRIN